nr:hypothetical protein [Dietzia massiliensis]
MERVQPPLLQQAVQHGDLPGDRGVDLRVRRSLGQPVAQQVEDVGAVPGLGATGHHDR